MNSKKRNYWGSRVSVCCSSEGATGGAPMRVPAIRSECFRLERLGKNQSKQILKLDSRQSALKAWPTI